MEFKKILIIFPAFLSAQIQSFEYFKTFEPVKKLLIRRDVQAAAATAALAYAGWRAYQAYSGRIVNLPIVVLTPEQQQENINKKFAEARETAERMDRLEKLLTGPLPFVQDAKVQVLQEDKKIKSNLLVQKGHNIKPALSTILEVDEKPEIQAQQALPQINQQHQIMQAPAQHIVDPNNNGRAQAQDQEEQKEEKELAEAGILAVDRKDAGISDQIGFIYDAFLFYKQSNEKIDLKQKITQKKAAFGLLYNALNGKDVKRDFDFGPLSFEQLVLENYAALIDLCSGDESDKAQFINQQLHILNQNSPWHHGKIIVKALLENDEAKIEQLKVNEEIFAKSKIYVVWYLYSLAVDKKQSFTEGTFAIVCSKKIFDFLFTDAYGRMSSHYNRDNKSKSALGFDIKTTGLIDLVSSFIGSLFGYAIPKKLIDELTFPNNKYHLLGNHILLNEESTIVEHIPEDYYYIKAEKSGTKNADDVIHHSWEFLNSLWNKAFQTGADDKDDMRKERIPSELINLWNSLINGFENLIDARKQQFKENAKKFGIKYILKTLREPIFSELSDQQKNLQKQLFGYLAQYDHLEIRAGREVILDDKALLG